jgi:hypothetical protein
MQEFKPLQWKSTVTAPKDAKRPQCRVLYSYDGIKGHESIDDTDSVDWLITIGYETQEEQQ